MLVYRTAEAAAYCYFLSLSLERRDYFHPRQTVASTL